MADIYPKQYLMTAGPTPLPPRRLPGDGGADPLPPRPRVRRRSTSESSSGSPRSSGPRTTCSASRPTGSGALESAVANLIAPGEPALVASCGKFGERWAELCEAFGADLEHLEFEWGEKVDPARVDEALSAMPVKPKVVFTTQSETSTGVLNDIAALASGRPRARRASSASTPSPGLGAAELPQDEWGVDVVVSGSQKSLMCPPGLGFASVSQTALDMAADGTRRPLTTSTGTRPRADSGSRRPTRRSRPPSLHFRGLDVALEQIFAEGLDNVFERHAILARAARAGVAGLGLERFGPDDPDANVVTAARLPEGIDGAKVPKTHARHLRGHRSPAVRGT